VGAGTGSRPSPLLGSLSGDFAWTDFWPRSEFWADPMIFVFSLSALVFWLRQKLAALETAIKAQEQTIKAQAGS